MIATKDIRRIVAGLSDYGSPVLSLYINASPGERERAPRSLASRARSTLEDLPVPDAVATRVLDHLARGRPSGRTTLIVADESRLDVYPLDVEIPVEDGNSGRVEARWGSPYLTPLLIALDENEHYGLVHVDRDHVRLFEVSHGGAEEITSLSRLKHPSELDTEAESRRSGQPYIPMRGDAAAQLADEHIRELSRSFHAGIVEDIRRVFDERELRRLIIAGPTEDRAQLEQALPADIRERVVEWMPSFVHREVSAAEVAENLEQRLAQLRDQREKHLLDRLAQKHAFGLDETLYAAQEGRLESLILPWPLEHTVYRDPDDRRLYADQSRPELEEVSLVDELAALSDRYNVKLEFVLGQENRERLERDFGGMGGIRRW